MDGKRLVGALEEALGHPLEVWASDDAFDPCLLVHVGRGDVVLRVPVDVARLHYQGQPLERIVATVVAATVAAFRALPAEPCPANVTLGEE